MNILFLTMNVFTGLESHSIYADLMAEFIRQGHRPYIVTPRERKCGERTQLIDCGDYSILKTRIGNTSGVSFVEKGISTVTLGGQFRCAVKQYLADVPFGLILYSTPPVTLATPVRSFKKRFRCPTYLMLKDIFPQNAVDLGLFSDKGPIYRYFRRLETKLYAISDTIGCMSEANVQYLLSHNPQISTDKVEICPNSIAPQPIRLRSGEREQLRRKYKLEKDKTVFVYGGNLGKPQGIDFLVQCLQSQQEQNNAFFLIVGDGSEFAMLEEYCKNSRQRNVKLLRQLPKQDYDRLIAACDVGLIFLDHRFTIPNFPSRLLSYLQAGLPVLSCTDPNTDVGRIAQENGFGLQCESSDTQVFDACVKNLLDDKLRRDMGERAQAYLTEHDTVALTYERIIKRCEKV